MVYNTPSFHITGVAMFSCVLMSLGFDVTAVIKVSEQHTYSMYAGSRLTCSRSEAGVLVLRYIVVRAWACLFELPAESKTCFLSLSLSLLLLLFGRLRCADRYVQHTT